MAVINLKMKIGIHLGSRQFKWVPAVNTNFLPLVYITSKGGVKRGFEHGKDIINEMEIGDEFREAIQQQNLIFGRFSDNYSLDLEHVNRTGQRLWALLYFWAVRRQGVSKGATLIMHNARVTWFHREMAQGKNFEKVKLEFPAEQARIEYRDNLEAVVASEMNRMLSSAANAIAEGVGAAQIR